jgi:hypothetical protein
VSLSHKLWIFCNSNQQQKASTSPRKKKKHTMSLEPETSLSPAAQRALKIIRALRRLPDTSGTLAAEKHALNQLRLPDLTQVALILQDDEEEEATND